MTGLFVSGDSTITLRIRILPHRDSDSKDLQVKFIVCANLDPMYFRLEQTATLEYGTSCEEVSIKSSPRREKSMLWLRSDLNSLPQEGS